MRSVRPRAHVWRLILGASFALSTFESLALAQDPPALPPAGGGAPQPPAPPGLDPARPPLMPSSSPPVSAPALPPAASSPRAPEPSTGAGTPQPATQGTDGNRAAVGARSQDVYSEDWWSHTRPIFEMHGYYRVRAELFHNFALGRSDDPNNALWRSPTDFSYVDKTGAHHDLRLCGTDPNPANFQSCGNKSQASANMRFRLDPELHISDNLRIVSQIDIFDNLVLGSTPAGYYNTTSQTGGTVVGTKNPYASRSLFTTTTDTPTAGQNSFQNSISVKRAWAEYMSPVGMLRFGRQPNHWGLGMYANSGDGYDSDYQSTIDRIMFTTSIKSLDLYFAGSYDFPNSGATSATPAQQQGQPYNLGQLDAVNQYTLTVVRRRAADLARQDLADGRAVWNGGIYAIYRRQYLANDTVNSTTSGTLNQSNLDANQAGLTRRNAWEFVPDLWGQVKYRKFRFEFEALTEQGAFENSAAGGAGSDYLGGNLSPNGWKIRTYSLATQAELKAVEDKLRVQFGFGWASGDPNTPEGPNALKGPPLNSPRALDRVFREGSFHPDYRVDLILFRNILSRVQGAYYFRPSVDYDFARNLNGQKFGGSAAVIWSRASEFVQAPGHKRDLGVELNLSVYYQSKDGSLNDDPERMGGFFTMLQYGVLFPLGGLGYQPVEVAKAQQQGISLDTGAAQIVRWYMGVLF